ncbi:tetratricopeptide repeat protein [Glycomyces dulcitolivorans]|uniref:tetratricopeptide repeat protein n=1 Tax=Glycomyces dulcitolivorans TaxID=2200759 RepID=UPI000DD4A0D4|nr:tetratricopeptide repeat protein [Glycomyces dulcitolivorans]
MADPLPRARVNLRPLRLRAMMTQEELALKSGVGTRTVRDIESGKVRPQPKTLRLLIEALDLDEEGRALLTGDAAPAPQVTPMTLPSGTAVFTGRREHLARLDAAAEGSSPLVVLTGVGGVGKTMLALHWGHGAADRFPGGRFYLDLRGFAPGAAPTAPAEAVRQLLGALGVEPGRVPAEADAQLALYRSLIGAEPRLLILDNARDAAQVRPLLPDAAQVHTLVISRHQLVGLAASHGARIIGLGAFDRDESAALLERQLGAERLAAEPEALEQILTACADLPLALAIAGARAAAQPGLALGEIAAELASSRLDALTAGEDAVDLRAVFSWSYQALGPAAARLFRLLALNPGPDFSAAAAIGLHGGAEADARKALRALAEAHLVEPLHGGRYRLHDLLRLYAAELLDAEPEDAALDRLLDWYLNGADACRSALYPAMVALPLPENRSAPYELTAEAAARWLKDEWENLIAAVEVAAAHGRPRFAWLVADATRGYFWLHMLGDDGVRIGTAAVAAANAAGDPLGQAAAEMALSCGLMRCNRMDETIEHFRAAAGFARTAGWPAGAASAEGNLAKACYYQGRLREGLVHAYAALHEFRAIGEHRAESTNLNLLGLHHALLGELDTGIDYLEQGLKIVKDTGNDPITVLFLTHLTEIEIHRGRLDAAAAHLEEAVELSRRSVSIDRTRDLPGATARLLLASGEAAEALELAKQAVAEQVGEDDHRNRAADMVTLAAAYDGMGEHREAVALYDRVLAMTEHDATVFHRVEAMVERSGALLRGGDAAGAEAAAAQALRTTREADYRFLEGRALNVLAEIDLHEGRPAAAADRATKAEELHRQTGHQPGEAESLRLLARIALAGGDEEAFLRRRDRARARYAEIGAPVPDDLAGE